MGFIEAIKAQHSLWKFKRSDLGQALRLHTQEFFHSGQALSWMEQENKDKFVQDFFGKLVACQQSNDPVMALRTVLVEHVIAFCQLQVLCLTPEEKRLQFYSENPYISGEVSSHIEQAVEHNDEVKKFVWQGDGATKEELMAFANTRSCLMLFYANGFNIARMAIGDREPAKDWYRPLVEAQLVWEEDNMRENLGLPRLLPAPLHGLAYSAMMNYVLNGERNPFFTFRQNFPDLYLGGEGPVPVSAD